MKDREARSNIVEFGWGHGALLASIAGLAIFSAAPARAADSAAEIAENSEPTLFEPGIISTGFDDAHVTFAPDGDSLYFIRNTPDFVHWTVLVAKRYGKRWGSVSVAPFSGRWSDADIFVSRDGKRLFFVSTRPVNDVAKTDSDIWTMERGGSGWGEPRHVPELSSEGYEWYPTLTESGVIYFGSERQGGLGSSDLWRARWLGDQFSAPENLGPRINSDEQEIEPLIAPDESWMIFAARGRKESAGSYDIYVTYNCADGWTEPQPLKGGVNSEGWDFGPRLSPDGKVFYFTSNRAWTGEEFTDVTDAKSLHRKMSSPGNGLRDIYYVDASALGLQSSCEASASNP